MHRLRGVPDGSGAVGADARRANGRRLVLSPVPAVHVPHDLGDYIVLTPNPRAAASLPGDVPFASLASRASDILQPSGTRPADAFLAQRTLLRAVREQADVSDPDGTAAMMAPRVRELLRAGIGELSLDESRLGERTRTLIAVTRRYRALLREAGPTADAESIDPAEAAWVAARALQPSQRVRLCVVGYPQVGRGEYALIDAYAAPGSLVVLPVGNDEAADVLGATGWRIERPQVAPRSVGERLTLRLRGSPTAAADAGAEPSTLRGDHGRRDSHASAGPAPDEDAVDVWSFRSQEAEVRHVLASVKTMLHAGVPASEIVLSTRDEAGYGPLLRAVAWEYEVPLAMSYAVPLTETRAGTWFAGLMELLNEDAPFEATARFLAHPLGAGLPLDAWRRARHEHPSDLNAWRALDRRLDAVDWPAGRAPRAAWRDRLLELLNAFRLDAGDAADAVALQRLGAAIQWVGAAEDEATTGATFLADVHGLLPHLSAPAAPLRAGVALHTPLALYGTTHAHVFLLGCVEGVLPEPVRDDPVLDLRERDALRAVGLPVDDVMAMVKREQRSFEAFLAGVGDHLTIGVPDEIAGQDHLPSPYLDRLGLEAETAPSRPLASREEARRQVLREASRAPASAGGTTTPPADPTAAPTRHALRSDAVLAAARHAWRVEMRRESGADADAFDGITGMPIDVDAWTFSATQLVALGQCGFKWFAGRRLRLEEPDERDDAVDPALRGLLWHRTLELTLSRALRRAKAGDTSLTAAASATERLRAAALAELDGAFTDAEEQVEMPPTRAWTALRAEHLKALRRVVGGASFLPEGADVSRLEARFRARWRGLHVRGIVDRIDRTDDGLTLWDYKTGSRQPPGAKDADGKATIDVQLPLYVQAAAPALFPGEPVAEARYFSLTKNAGIAKAKIDDEELDALASHARSALEHGSFPVEPDVDAKACAYCPFDLVCRVGPRIERKRAEREAAAAGSAAAGSDG